MLFTNQSAFTMDNIIIEMSGATSQLEAQMNAALLEIQSNPNPSQADLTVFQALLTQWSSLITMESSIIKVYGDTMKSVASNMGS